MVSQSIIQVITIQMKLQIALKLFWGNAKAVEKSFAAVQKVPGSSANVRKYCGTLFFALLYDTSFIILSRWDEEVIGLTQWACEASLILIIAPLDRFVVRSLEEPHHPSIVPGVVFTNFLFGNRIGDSDNAPPEGIPLLVVTKRALQEKCLVLDQPFHRVVKEPEAKAFGLDAATFHKFVANLENVTVDVVHTAQHGF